MAIICAGASDIGRKRKTNQDSIGLFPESQFYVVADGMGGHNGGDIASQLSVKVIPEYIGQNPSKTPSELMRDVIIEINRQILDTANKNPELKGMGTTLSAIMFNGPQLILGNVGDSRVYMIHNQAIFQLTRDHSFVQEKLNLGIYTREDAARDPQKNVLVRSVGIDEDMQADVFNYRICKNDIFLICSDGLHGKVSDRDILFIVQKHLSDPETCDASQVQNLVDELIRQANENGGQDNISVIIAVAQA